MRAKISSVLNGYYNDVEGVPLLLYRRIEESFNFCLLGCFYPGQLALLTPARLMGRCEFTLP